MKKLFTLCVTLLSILSFTSCTVEGDKQSSGTTPTITITQVEVTAESFTFQVVSSEPGTLGYVCVPNDFEKPSVGEWFAANSESVSGTAQFTVSELNENTEYTLYAILRAKNGGNLSAPRSLKFTTPDDGKYNPIVIRNTTYNTISFTINIEASYLFQVIDIPYLEYNNITIEEYIRTQGYGIPSKGVQDIDWVDGNTWGVYEMRVREDREYYVVAAIANGQEVVGDIYYKKAKTPKRPDSSANLKTELKDITSTSVTIKTTPDASVTSYYILVRDKAWSDYMLETQGESMLSTLVAYPNSGSWQQASAIEKRWEGLNPDTEYYCHVLVLDNKNGQSLERIPFTTKKASGAAAVVEASLTPAQQDGHTTLNLNLYSEDAATVRCAFSSKVKLDNEIKNYGLTESQYIESYGMDLSAEQVNAMKTTGLTIKQEDLFPGIEYVALVSVRNAERTETVKVTSATTPEKAVPARVESELFTSLLGEWEVSYPLYQFNDKNVNLYNAKVTIAQGADSDTEEYYRSYNRLVVQGWPFNVEHDGTHNAIPYCSPSDLKELSNTWKNYPAFALRDYGPKIFLEIGEGDVITIPTSRYEYLYNWAEDGTFYFFGGDLQNGFTAPVTFPVTLSEDGNTLTISACQAGAEFDHGIYRPSVFRNDLTDYRAIATDDVVLKRVK